MDKELENRIKTFMIRQLADGKQLSEIQNLVNAEFSAAMTYMDIRILASTLDVDWQKVSPSPAPEPETDKNTAQTAADNNETLPPEEEDLPPPPPAASGNTKVEINKLARPGMMFSGTVTFANGSTADWFVDNMGRLGLDNLQGEQPGQNDIEDFQITLNNELRKIMGR